MLIDITELKNKYSMNIQGVVHAGAHLGEEAEAYKRTGINEVLWIEGNPDLIPQLSSNVARFCHKVTQALLSDVSGEEVIFHITNNGQSSSLLDFGTHARVSPDVHFIEDKILFTETLDEVIERTNSQSYNFLNMDLQGAELLCLKGATEALKRFDYIYTEINVDELYIDCVQLPELDEFLDGFARVETQLAGDQKRHQSNWVGWGDALYVRETLYE